MSKLTILPVRLAPIDRTTQLESKAANMDRSIPKFECLRSKSALNIRTVGVLLMLVFLAACGTTSSCLTVSWYSQTGTLQVRQIHEKALCESVKTEISRLTSHKLLESMKEFSGKLPSYIKKPQFSESMVSAYEIGARQHEASMSTYQHMKARLILAREEGGSGAYHIATEDEEFDLLIFVPKLANQESDEAIKNYLNGENQSDFKDYLAKFQLTTDFVTSSITRGAKVADQKASLVLEDDGSFSIEIDGNRSPFL